MDSLSEFYRVAGEIRNWGRWGDADEIGTLNLITAETVQRAASLVRQGKVFALGIEFGTASPQGALNFRQRPLHLMTVDGGDDKHYGEFGVKWENNAVAQEIGAFFQPSPFRFNDDVIVMPLQASTQWDALSHVYYDDRLYNGFPSSSVTSAGAFHCGIDKAAEKGVTSRGVLIDIVKHRGVEFLAPGNDITPDELDEALRAQGVGLEQGDIVMVRTGWIAKFRETGNSMEPSSGLSWRCAQWLREHEVAAVVADNIMVESLESGVDGMFLPLHLLALRDMGMMLGEFWYLDALAADCALDGIYEFQVVAPSLQVTGGVGSPVNPIVLK